MAKIKLVVSATIEETFSDFIISKKTKGLAEKTLQSYQSQFQAVARHMDVKMDIAMLQKADLDAMIISMRDASLSPNSINSYTRTLKSFFSWCNEQGITRLNIPLYKAEETVKETYSDLELSALLKKPDIRKATFAEYRDWVIINFLLNCGSRAATVRAIQIRDVDLDGGMVFYRHTKNRKAQVIPLCSAMVAILREYLRHRGGEAADYLFCTETGSQLTENGLRQSIARYNTRRGVQKTSIHLFRHTFARKYLIDCGGDAFNKQFAAISSYDVDDLNAKKDKRLAEEKAKAEKDAAEAAVQAEKNKKMAVKIGVIAAVATVIVVAASFVATKIIIPSNNYKAAEAMLAEGDYDGAIKGFTALADYKDSADRVIKAEAAKLEAKNAAAYAEAEAMLANKNYESAIAAFEALGDYKDSATQILETKYQRAVEWIEETKLLEAYEAFLELGDYKDSKEYFSDLYFIPKSISSDNYTYQFSYDENVQMYYAARTKFGITYEYSFSDGCAESVIRKGKTENDSIFVWKEDGTVEEYKTGTEGVEKYYDTYGNCISVRKADGEYKNGENELDAAHNVVKGIHLYDLRGGTTAENYYDDFGNLTYVSRAARNAINNSLFTYSLSYIKDVPVDMDVIWKNVRIICGQDVWHHY